MRLAAVAGLAPLLNTAEDGRTVGSEELRMSLVAVELEIARFPLRGESYREVEALCLLE